MRHIPAINPEELLLAYRLGIFPMAESRHAKPVLWVRPHERGILPIDGFHVPKRLARTVRTDRFQVRVDTQFGDVIRGCAESKAGRRETWINDAIIEVFEILHDRKLAHSIEVFDKDRLVGGLYGLALGGAFFAESKFSRATDASKVALVHLVARLKAGGFSLLDTQFPNPHLDQFGAMTVTEERFQKMLAAALDRKAEFYCLGRAGAGTSAGSPGGAAPSAGAAASAGGVSGASVLQVITQTS